jgi:pyridoxamine 5'-phosphate oxidase-like protein
MSNDVYDEEEPEASRPSLPPQYGILGQTEGQGLLPWHWATERLARSRGYWFTTMRPDGRPHVAVVWGVWLHDAFYFGTIASSRKARNLAANPNCVVCPEQTDEAVILEGVAEQVIDPTQRTHFHDAYATKYQEELDPDEFIIYAMRPRVAFAFISDAIAYPRTATRWTF